MGVTDVGRRRRWEETTLEEEYLGRRKHWMEQTFEDIGKRGSWNENILAGDFGRRH